MPHYWGIIQSSQSVLLCHGYPLIAIKLLQPSFLYQSPSQLHYCMSPYLWKGKWCGRTIMLLHSYRSSHPTLVDNYGGVR
uniref:Uncharacterized protein n=1 Tax=Picea glauca TaxID=3330 RepID=A0A101M010_PICGL|nr:hypothetical protein ABT39_MTgene4524 [Picea glauca]QHR86705.1 hypothetical protein Q903MT_gene709 [Picea sitchensis]